MDYRAPLRETGAHIAVRRQAIPKSVEALRNCFTWSPRERLRTCVDLDPRQDTLLRKHLDERRAVGAFLPDGFVMHDDAADELGRARGKKHFAVGAAALL